MLCLLGIFVSFPYSILSTLKTMVLFEVFLGAFLQVLFDRLGSREVLGFARRYVGLKKNLYKWKENLKKIQAVLDDADERLRQDNDGQVERWLADLRHLAYDVEDMLDEFATEASRAENQASTSKVRNLIPACCPSCSAFKTMSDIDKITDRFNKIVKEKDELRLTSKVGGGKIKVTESTSFVNERGVVGREKDKEAVLHLLRDETYNNDDGISVISIHGMGGVGKTTLAKLVYNGVEKTDFAVKVWAYVSDVFNVDDLRKKIYSSIIYAIHENEDLADLSRPQFILNCNNPEVLQDAIREALSGKKFLVILDDVWSTCDPKQWESIHDLFVKGSPESRIIITTRDREVSTKMGNVPAYSLQVLSEEDCFSVFTKNALQTRGIIAVPNIDHRVKIYEKCKGLPLAAETLGNLLKSVVPGHRKWEDVLDRRILDAKEERDGILSFLMPSYHHLPLHLKRCFAHCSIILKGHEFEEKQLVLLWMAEGLIQPQRNKQMEDLGSEYFQELVNKSLLEKLDESRFMMHDVINDLAQWVAKDTCFRIDDRFEDSNIENFLKKARHLSYSCGGGDCCHNFEALSELTCLRAFLPLVKPSQGQYFLSCKVPLHLLPKLRCLRVLSLNRFRITELSESIGDLKRLRYLDLSNTDIESLPESTTALYNLQTLLLENCPKLKQLPSMFQKLVNLRHLNIRKTCSLKGMPLQMGKLTCLQTLSDFVVGKGPFSGVKELRHLSHLRETLCISRLENVIQPGDARYANLIEKTNLGGLLLEWSDDPQERTNDLEVINKLQPHKDLKELTIKRYGGTEFPSWLRTPSFPNMVRLRLENCEKCTSLPPVGQLSSLKYLSIIGMAGVQKVGPEFYEGDVLPPFGSLKTLCFENMEKWADWIPCGEFPHLRELSIQNCPKLSGKLPNHLPSLETYQINECHLLKERPRTKVVHDGPQAESSV